MVLKYYYQDKIRNFLLAVFVWPGTVIAAFAGAWLGYNNVGTGAAIFFGFLGGIGGRLIGKAAAYIILFSILYWRVTITVITLSILGAASYHLWDVRL
ncbi:MAG: hypothetical protein D3906_13480 [Candidatus Electrothrix sp. AUS1_2]|nr:hypothetical protein [Candidatus Electrothrix sp. AUS1_2]